MFTEILVFIVSSLLTYYWYVGVIEGTTPCILIRDPELIKQITIKDFEHFPNHKEFFTEDMEPLFARSLIMMKDDKWHDMRATLSPAFTGSKMRQMMPFITDICNNLIENLKAHAGEDIDVQDMMSRFTTDVIASTAFGFQVNSFKDRNNEFFTMGQNLFNFSVWQRIYFMLSAQFPNIAKHLRIYFQPTKVTKFFSEIVTTTMEYREKNNVVRYDMIHLLMEATKEWSQKDLVGQVFTFFVAGFETSSSTVTMCLHELALSPEIQEKLYQEIKDFKENKGNPTYENLKDLMYLDCVINETFRKWSVALFMDRVCTKDYYLPPAHDGGKQYRVKAGDYVYNVVNSIQMDPKYFPDPEVFKPERFSEENKHNIKPFTFMPFGMGPRACIGSRFALLELKMLLFHVILNFNLIKSKKTEDPIRMMPLDFNIKAQGGTWLKMEPRK